MPKFAEVLAAYENARRESVQADAKAFQAHMQSIEPMRELVRQLLAALEWPQDMWAFMPQNGENIAVGSAPPVTMIEQANNGDLGCVVRLFLDTRGAHFDVAIHRGRISGHPCVQCLSDDPRVIGNDQAIRTWATDTAEAVKNAVVRRFSSAG